MADFLYNGIYVSCGFYMVFQKEETCWNGKGKKGRKAFYKERFFTADNFEHMYSDFKIYTAEYVTMLDEVFL